MRYFLFFFLSSLNLYSYVITNENKDFLPVFYVELKEISTNKITQNFKTIFLNSINYRLKKVNANFLYEKVEKIDFVVSFFVQSVDNKRVEILLKISDRNNTILEKKFISYLDRRLFDSVDEILFILKKFVDEIKIVSIEVKKRKIAMINFKNFDVGKENYFLYLNDNLISKYVNKHFSKIVNVEAEKTYTIRLKQDKNEKIVFEEDVFLNENEIKEIEYTAKGILFVKNIKNPELWKEYKYFLDDEEVFPEREIGNLKAGRHYNIMVKDKDSIVYNDVIYLEDGKITFVEPFLNYNDYIKIKFFSAINEFWAMGIDYDFFRYFWIGVNFGFNTYYYEEKSIDKKFLTIEAGFYYFSYNSINFKSGIGIGGQLNFSESKEENGISAFLNFELFNFFIKPAVFYNFEKFDFQAMAGLYLTFLL